MTWLFGKAAMRRWQLIRNMHQKKKDSKLLFQSCSADSLYSIQYNELNFFFFFFEIQELQQQIMKHLVVRFKLTQMTQVTQWNTSWACNWSLALPTFFWNQECVLLTLQFSYPFRYESVITERECRRWFHNDWGLSNF